LWQKFKVLFKQYTLLKKDDPFRYRLNHLGITNYFGDDPNIQTITNTRKDPSMIYQACEAGGSRKSKNILFRVFEIS